MDYFKHYSTASESKSLNTIFDKFGHKGIAFWWMLVELCAENWDGESEPEFCFHQRTVTTKLKSSLNSVRTWLELCSNSGLCAFAHFETQFEIKMPKLREVKETRGRIKGNKSKKIDIYRIDKEEDKDICTDTESFKPEFFEGVIDSPKKNLPSIQSQDFRNSKDSPVLEMAEARENSVHKKLAAKGSIMSPEWIVIEHFNKANGKNLRQVESNYKEIKARVKEGFSSDEMIELIDFAAKAWANDAFWSAFNRPSTLFNKKFNEYLEKARSANKPKIDPLDALAEKLGLPCTPHAERLA